MSSVLRLLPLLDGVAIALLLTSRLRLCVDSVSSRGVWPCVDRVTAVKVELPAAKTCTGRIHTHTHRW